MDDDRVSNASVFEDDRRVAASVQSHAPDVTRLLAESDELLAETAVDDAERVRRVLRERGISFNETTVDAEIEDATAALNRAAQMRERGNHVGAIAQYEEAWIHAQRALDRMDRAVAPSVSISSRRDPRHDGTIEYTVSGRVFDVHVHDLTNVTLTVDGERYGVTVEKPTTPGANATFEATVTLTDEPHAVVVNASDPGREYSDLKDGGSSDVQHGSDRLYLDGDRLRDHFESRRAHTNPLNPNSDSPDTDANESVNATPDDREDLDSDDAINYREQGAGTDPLDADTDDDRLRDGFEIQYENVSAIDADTDDNGTGDAEEDLEPDGLTNVREQSYNTNPNNPDTDDDNLQDGPEIDRHGTGPLDPDTDSEGLQDGSEVHEYGTDPLDRDTDEEGLNDSEEVQKYGTDPLKSDTDGETLNDSAEVDLYGTDPLDNDTDSDGLNDSEEIRRYGTDPLNPDTENDGLQDGPEVANGTDPFDPDTDGEGLEDGPEVHKYETDPLNPDTDSEGLTDAEEVREYGTDPLNPDTDADRLTDAEEVREYDTDPQNPDTDADGLGEGAEVLDHGTNPLAPDTDSDDLNDGPEVHEYETKPLVADTDGEGLEDGPEVENFSTEPLVPDTDADRLTDAEEVREYDTDPLNPDTDGDAVEDGNETEIEMRPRNPDSDSNRTDPDESGNGVTDGDEDLDRDDVTNSEEFDADLNPLDPDTENDRLRDGFELEYRALDPHTSDSDRDGTPDADEDFESDGLVNLREQGRDADPHNPDTDADNLTDGPEVHEYATDPTEPDTDGDRLQDGPEVTDYGTEPLNDDTDGDGLTDGTEVLEHDTDPLDSDTDDDNLTDAEEVNLYETSPLDSDSDDDGLQDGPEIDEYETKPLVADTDTDNLTDGPEVHEYASDPLDPDTDADNLTDGPEVHEYGTDPLLADTDADNLTDSPELFKYETDPLDNDTDADLLLDGPEIANRTIPLDDDTDDDGLEDGPEVLDYESDPLDTDTDNETIWDGPEVHEFGTDPNASDTDGDVLNDSTELNRTKTDPLVADSDSALTDRDESGNNVTDGDEDFDADALATYYEYALATDPFDNDTDGDGLPDGYETQFGIVDPRTAHTDKDSVPDAREDFDNDSLATGREQQLGTHLNDSDTDGEGLVDGEEVSKYGTDPLAVDTDDDRLNDSEEFDLPTDPTVADTDGDGTLDGNETFTTAKTDEDTGVTLSVTGEGNVAASVSINNSSKAILQTDSVENVSASNVYDFEAAANFTMANVTLPYNESKVTTENESNLGAYRYNETLQTFVPVENSTVDTANDTVTAETSHFSTYAVLSSAKWQSRFDETPPSKWSNTDNFSDLSGWESGGNVSTKVEAVESVGSFAVRENDTGDASDSDRNATVVVGSLTRPTERNWTEPVGNKTRPGERNESGDNSSSECLVNTSCVVPTTEETTTEETTEEQITTEDSYEDSDEDGTYDRYDGCVDNPGEDNGCPQHSDDDGIKDWNDDCDSREGEGDGCPTHSDEDDLRDFYDDCENTPGLGEDGCAINGDDDDHNDFYDDCPDDAGEGSDGCPIDDDRDDTRNYYDKCPQFPGWKANGCPRTSSLERNVTVRDAETVTVGTIAKATAVSNRSVAELVVVGPDGERVEVYGEENTKTSSASEQSVEEIQLGAQAVVPGGDGDAPGDFEAVEQDISQFAGERVTIKIVTVGRATFEINALKIGYDTDGDGFYDAVERGSCGLRNGVGQCLDTDPLLADTDGDGLSDNYEVGERKKVHGHVYQSLRSNPTVRDTDHDGLDDEQEVRGSFRIAVTRSPEASRKYLNGQAPEDKREHLSTELTDSDPLKADTDGDRLRDREEWLHKTDPRDEDSDGDGLLDGRERPIDADPTLHDYRGPDIRLAKHGYIANYTENEIQYVLEYLVFDPSRVQQTTVRKNGNTRYDSSSNALISRHNGSFTVSSVEAIADHLAGARVKITATDSHGNRETKVGIRKANAVGQLAGKLDADTIYAESAAGKLGALSGFSTGFGGTVKSVLGLVHDPLGFVESLTKLVGLLDESGLLDMFIDAFFSSLETKQKTNNPYSKGSALYDDFRRNWYAGYTVAFVTKAVAGASATKAVKSSTYVQKVSTVAKSTRAGKAALRVKAPYDRAKARVATGLTYGARKAGGSIVRRAKSAGAVYRLWKLQRKADVDADSLSTSERERVTEYLARHGEEGATNLRWMDDEDFDALFHRACDGDVSTSETGGGGCAELTEVEQDRYEDAVIEADVDPAAFDDRLERLDVNEGSAKRVFAQTGTSSVKLASQLDDDSLARFVAMDEDARRVIVESWRADQVEITSDKVEEIATTLRGLDSDTKDRAIRAMDDAGKDGFWLVRNVPESRLNELADKGIDLERHAEGLGIYRRSGKSLSKTGDMAEIIAQETVVQSRFDSLGKLYPREYDGTGIDLYNPEGEDIGEFDHLVMRSDGTVLKVIETKTGTTKADEANNDLENTLKNIEDDGLGEGTTARLEEKADFSDLSPSDKQNLITVGPKDGKGFDLTLKFTSRELKALYKTAKKEGI